MYAGAAVGPYQIIRHLGAGGMGAVWLAEDTRLNRKVALKSVSKSRPRARLAGSGSAETGRTLTVTIFLFRTGHGNKIRTSPQRLYANPGDRIEWNVVNLIDGSDVPVTITWSEQGPWGKEPIQVRSWQKEQFGQVSGRFKYVVSALDAKEDPEIELPEGN